MAVSNVVLTLCLFYFMILFTHTHTHTQIGCDCGDVRLRGGESYFEGRVEICLVGEWYTITVCDDSWNSPDARVVCSQLGLSSPGS